MFDKKDIEAYQSIVVPSGLRGRIERDHAAKQSKPRVIGGSRFQRLALPMAACLILLCTVFFNLPAGNAATLYYGGAPVTEQRTLLGNEFGRAAEIALVEEPVSLALTIEAKGSFSLSVSAGRICSPEGEEILYTGETKELKGEQELLWIFETNDIIPFELRLCIEDDILVYVLDFDKDAGRYVMYQK